MRGKRRAMAQMNVVPYIDVMLVLLVIFMVAAPMMQPGVVNLPQVGKAETAPASPLEITITASGEYSLRDPEGKSTNKQLALDDLVSRIKDKLASQAERPVVISADKAVRYEKVLHVMDKLQREQIARVGLLVKPQGK
ncbi:MAG: protein TolR [Rhodocyclaceae bacterium]|nr:MAG: protein TolR [Rhodocyclaceae bacterium]